MGFNSSVLRAALRTQELGDFGITSIQGCSQSDALLILGFPPFQGEGHIKITDGV
jgi:hypothetical protein